MAIRYGIVESVDGKYFKVHDNGAIFQPVRILGSHGKSIQSSKLKYIPLSIPSGSSGAFTSGPALPPGTYVKVEQDTGEGDSTLGRIVGIAQGKVDMAGIKNFVNEDPRTVPLNNVEELMSVENRAGSPTQWFPKDVREFILKNFDGLFPHGAEAPFMTSLIPDVKRIETALQSSTSRMTADLQALIPGNIFSLGQLKDLLTDSMKKEIFDAIPADAAKVLNSLLNNLQTASGGSINGKRVNLPVFLANVVNELKNVKTPNDVMEKIMSIMQDESLSGMDLLSNIEVEIEGPFGNTTLQIDSSGNITENLNDTVNQAILAFNSALGGVAAASGSIFDQFNDFGDVKSRLDKTVQVAMNTMVGRLT